MQADVANFISANAISTQSARSLKATGDMVKHFDTKNSSVR
jgi:hypothetical protein